VGCRREPISGRPRRDAPKNCDTTKLSSGADFTRRHTLLSRAFDLSNLFTKPEVAAVSMSDSKSFSEFLKDLERTIEATAPQLLSFTAQQTRQVRARDAWTRKQILGHLIDSAANNHQRFVGAQFKNDLVFPGYEQEKWVDVQHYNDEDWSQMVQLWKLYNLHLVHVASFIPSAVLEKERAEHNLDQIAWQTVDKQKSVTLEYFIRDYAGHMRHHLGQIFESAVYGD
jgi:hypothetical protein